MPISTATVTGTVYDDTGTPLASSTVRFHRLSRAVVAFADGTLAPGQVDAATDASGVLGVPGDPFQAGVDLVLGKYVMSVTAASGARPVQATVVIDQNAVDAGAVDLEEIVGPAPDPQVVTAAQVARDAAQSARTAAETAQSAAEAAAQAAAGGAATAGNAENGAVAANNAAQTAKTAAETAQGAAEAAATTAAQAQARAETAQAGAENAQTGAQGARTDAIAAKDAAEAAQSAAESAQTAAVSAKNSAESASASAIAARDKAEAWAETPEDTEVEPGAFSALHHAAKAAEIAGKLPDPTGLAAGRMIEANGAGDWRAPVVSDHVAQLRVLSGFHPLLYPVYDYPDKGLTQDTDAYTIPLSSGHNWEAVSGPAGGGAQSLTYLANGLALRAVNTSVQSTPSLIEGMSLVQGFQTQDETVFFSTVGALASIYSTPNWHRYLILNWKDNDNFIAMRYNYSEVALFTRIAGVDTALGSVGPSNGIPGKEAPAKIECLLMLSRSGSSDYALLQARVNGRVFIETYLDFWVDFPLTSGRVGIAAGRNWRLYGFWAGTGVTT